MQKAIFSLLIFLFMLVDTTSGQYSFVNYDYTNGLPLDEISVIKKDSLGYIWLGGPLGLAKFDGRKFTHYYKGSPNGNLPGNIVNDIDITPSGKVVTVFDDNGISIYNPENHTFKSRIFSEEDPLSFPQYSIFSSFIINDTTAYICANREGLFEINLETLDSRKIFDKHMPTEIIQDLTKDSSYLFINKGLLRFDASNNSTERYTNQGFYGLRYIDGKIWYNSYNHYIFSYDLKSHESRKNTIKSSGVIRGWAMVGKNLWVATRQGIEVIDAESGEHISMIKSGPRAQDIAGDFIYEIFKDSKGRVWIATDGGLSLYDPSRSSFAPVDFLPEETTFLTEVNEDKYISLDFYSSRAWHINTDGVSKEIKIKGGLRQPLKTIKLENGIGVLFFNGIGYIDVQSNTIKPLDSPFTNSARRGLIDLSIKDGVWYGIYVYDDIILNWNKATGSLDTVATNGQPRGILHTPDEKVWTYGPEVFCSYDIATGTTTHYTKDNPVFSDLRRDIVYIDEVEDRYWISTRTAGIWSAEYLNGQFKLLKQYDQHSGLLNNTVVMTHVDNDHNFYLTNRAGIFKYNKTRDRFTQVGQKKEINIQKAHGLTSINDNLYALGFKNKYIPTEGLDKATSSPMIELKSVHVNGDYVQEYNSKLLDLKYSENNLMISYDIIYFDDHSLLKFRYRLNENEDWIYTNNVIDDLSLTALSDGKYHVEISVCDKYGQWISSEGLTIMINRPFWRTWWFLLLIFGGLSFIGYSIYSMRMNQLKKLNSMNLKLAELESESLRSQMNPHFIFNALNSIKAYIIKNNKEDAADYLSTFSELIRAVLRNSKEKEISLQNEMRALSLYLQIEKFRLDQKFDFQINIPNEIQPDRVAFPPLIIQPFVENSIWHGFVNKKTKGLLNINVNKINSSLVIEIIDDGIGREASKKIEKSRGRERSFGIAITENRLSNIAAKAEIQIIDLYDDNGMSRGTKVLLNVPFKLIDNNIPR